MTAPREAAWRRWLDVALSLVGLDELANFQKRPAATPLVRLEEQAAARPEQVNVGEPPQGPPALPVTLRRGTG